MRFWELCRTGNWPTLVGIVLYAATSCLCALAGGAIFDLPMSSLQIALLFPAPLLGGAVLLCLLLITGNDPYRANPFSSTLRASFWARQTETWWVCFLHAVTFGGFAVLTSYLTVFFHVRHGLGLVQAAAITTVVVVACCALRPVGGLPGRPVWRDSVAVDCVCRLRHPASRSGRLAAVAVDHNLAHFGHGSPVSWQRRRPAIHSAAFPGSARGQRLACWLGRPEGLADACY